MKVNELLTAKSLLENKVDHSELDATTYDSIKSEVESLAKDENSEFPTALALVHDAYEIANVERPTPAMRDGWAQYEALIALAVQYLAKYRPDGNWRLTTATSKDRK
jgi:hypothetical protein